LPVAPTAATAADIRQFSRDEHDVLQLDGPFLRSPRDRSAIDDRHRMRHGSGDGQRNDSVRGHGRRALTREAQGMGWHSRRGRSDFLEMKHVIRKGKGDTSALVSVLKLWTSSQP
jgi:hypothetical protein